ncbi:MAG TPA: cytochrome P450 [Longimicrobiales bacterium]|nr:cytochrome P450 [Longimicrobiales bacterium]
MPLPYTAIPGPRARPIVGNIPDIAPDMLGFWTRMAREHGDFAAFRVGGWPSVLVSDPDAIETVLVKRHRSFIKHRLFFRHVTALFGDGLLTAEGDFWLRQRRLAAPAFHTERLNAYARVMTDYTDAMLAGWRDGEERDAHHEMMGVTMRIVSRTLFGTEVEEVDDIGRAFDRVANELPLRFRRLFRIPDWVPTPGNLRYGRGLRRLNALVEGIIAERREDGEDRGDLLSMLMSARDEDGRPMSHKQLRDEAVTLFLAGHETTALALSWAWWLLARHPDAEARLHRELDDVLGSGPGARTPTVADLPRLPFADAVISEAMRLYPPAWTVGREATEDVDVGPYRLPRGTTVYLSPWVMHRHPRWWSEPEAFRPERWLGDGVRGLPRFVYMPFGGGPRICIGNRFAQMEAVLVLATVASRWRLEWRRERPVVPFAGITLRPEGGVWVDVRAREGAGAPQRQERNAARAHSDMVDPAETG